MAWVVQQPQTESWGNSSAAGALWGGWVLALGIWSDGGRWSDVALWQDAGAQWGVE